jgi:hypothetical protein
MDGTTLFLRASYVLYLSLTSGLARYGRLSTLLESCFGEPIVCLVAESRTEVVHCIAKTAFGRPTGSSIRIPGMV